MIDILLVDFYDGSRWRQMYEAVEAAPDIDALAVGMILTMPKVTWASPEQASSFFEEVKAREVKVLMSPFPTEDLLVAVAALAGKRGKSLLEPEERGTCLQKNRSLFQRRFDCLGEEITEWYDEWIESLEAAADQISNQTVIVASNVLLENSQ
jgi:hypothetical protein